MSWRQIGERQVKFTNVGDSIEGELLSTEQSALGVNYYHIEQESGEIVGTLGSIGLDRLMENVNVGDRVKIVYGGMVKTKGGQRFKNFDVFIEVAEE